MTFEKGNEPWNKGKKSDICCNCHKEKREKSFSYCKKCRKEYDRIYRFENLDKCRVREECRKLRKDIIETRNNQCELCGDEDNLQVHHITYDNSPENLLVVCRSCHQKIHKIQLNTIGGEKNSK